MGKASPLTLIRVSMWGILSMGSSMAEASMCGHLGTRMKAGGRTIKWKALVSSDTLEMVLWREISRIITSIWEETHTWTLSRADRKSTSLFKIRMSIRSLRSPGIRRNCSIFRLLKVVIFSWVSWLKVRRMGEFRLCWAARVSTLISTLWLKVLS